MIRLYHASYPQSPEAQRALDLKRLILKAVSLFLRLCNGAFWKGDDPQQAMPCNLIKLGRCMASYPEIAGPSDEASLPKNYEISFPKRLSLYTLRSSSLGF